MHNIGGGIFLREKRTGTVKTKHERIICRFLLLRLLSYLLFLSACAVLLPCLPCAVFPSGEVISVLPLLSFASENETAARLVCAVLAAVGGFLLMSFFAVRFALMCECMYAPGRGLSLPKNMMTLKNGVRYFAFCVLRAVSGIKRGLLFFLPSVIASVLLLSGLNTGLGKTAAIVAAASCAGTVLLGVVFFACDRSGRMKGVCTLYLSPLASPVTAARAAESDGKGVAANIGRELSLLPFHLLSLVPLVHVFAEIHIKRIRGRAAVDMLTCGEAPLKPKKY